MKKIFGIFLILIGLASIGWVGGSHLWKLENNILKPIMSKWKVDFGTAGMNSDTLTITSGDTFLVYMANDTVKLALKKGSGFLDLTQTTVLFPSGDIYLGSVLPYDSISRIGKSDSAFAYGYYKYLHTDSLRVSGNSFFGDTLDTTFVNNTLFIGKKEGNAFPIQYGTRWAGLLDLGNDVSALSMRAQTEIQAYGVWVQIGRFTPRWIGSPYGGIFGTIHDLYIGNNTSGENVVYAKMFQNQTFYFVDSTGADTMQADPTSGISFDDRGITQILPDSVKTNVIKIGSGSAISKVDTCVTGDTLWVVVGVDTFYLLHK